MKRQVLVFLLLLFLCGCASAPAGPLPAEPTEEPTPEEAPFTLPETVEAEPISAEAAVTQGRTPAEDYDLPPSPPWDVYGRQYDMVRWASGGVLSILAEARDAAFYALPYSKDAHETALIRWGDSLAEFDWSFATPRLFPPRMAALDLDGDGEEELAVLCYTGSGTGVSIYDLHVLEKDPDGTLTDYAMPESLWREQLPPLLKYVRTGGRNFLILGRQLLELDPEVPEWASEERMEPSAGWIADFHLLTEENAVQFLGAVSLWHPDHYVAGCDAAVQYRDGVFTLSGFQLY